jgi:hypothetical protein
MNAIGPPEQHLAIPRWRGRLPERIRQVRSDAQRAVAPSPPFILSSELPVDLILPTPIRSFIHCCIRPRDRFLCVELKLVERRLFRRVRMLEKCCRTARYCKQTGPSNRISTEKTHTVSRFRIGGSDLRYTASHLKHRALQSTAETAIPDQPSCSPCQTDVTSSFLPAHRGRTGRVGRTEYRDSGSFAKPTGYTADTCSALRFRVAGVHYQVCERPQNPRGGRV